MKRAPFLGITGAALLAGCGGHGGAQSIPGLTSPASQPSKKPLQLVPAVADAIPDSVLQTPFVGEGRRFDGAVAPNGWMLAQGQSLTLAAYPTLFSVIGTMGGGDGKRTFMLPNVLFGFVIAVNGVLPNSPSFLAASKRRPTALASLGGPSARLPMPAPPKQPSQQLRDAQALIASSVRVGGAHPQPVSPQVADSITQAKQSAQAQAVAQLSPANRVQLQNVVERAVSGQTTVQGAILAMKSSLTPGEASALLGVNDGMIRAFNPNWSGSSRANAQTDAAHFLISVAITREQAIAISERESN
jgi:hypothetical protein